jgi:hypothetical protein
LQENGPTQLMRQNLGKLKNSVVSAKPIESLKQSNPDIAQENNQCSKLQ